MNKTNPSFPMNQMNSSNSTILSNQPNQIAITSLVLDKDVEAELTKALTNFDNLGRERGFQAQAALCPQYIANNIKKDKALQIMATTLSEQEQELEAYEQALGRKLTQQEVNDFIQKNSSPAFLAGSNKRILDRLNKNLALSRQLTKQ